MNKEKLKEWFQSLDQLSKVEHIKKQSIRLHSLKKSMDKAVSAEYNYGFNRVGVRGGKFTSLNAKSCNCTRMFLDCEETLKYIVNLL